MYIGAWGMFALGFFASWLGLCVLSIIASFWRRK